MLTEKANSGTVNYRSPQYLIKSFTVGYAYSASVLFNNSVESAWSPSLLAVSFTPSGAAPEGTQDMQIIAGAEEEMKMLSARFGGGEFLTGPDATETNFKSIAPGFDILNLAVHGRGKVEKDFSASLYFDSKYDSLDDGVLHAYELYGLKLKAAMAVLTACESGLGKGYRGEGMMSMANAFSYSGCQNILMSLWKVYDQASQGLMNDFYGNLLDGNSIDDALRQTKLHYLETADELSADPKVWAPMVAYGSLNEVFPKRKSATIYTIAAVAAVAFLLLLVFRKKLVRKL
jgi:CHAT domain-containing protein